MRLVRALGSVDQPSGNDARDGNRVLNNILEQISLERQMALTLREESVSWPAFAAFRGIGEVTPLPPGSYNLPRPLRIEKAAYVSGTSDTPIEPIQQDQYADYRAKQTQGSPLWIYYRADVPQGTIFLLPIPVTSITLKIWYQQAFAVFETPQSQIDLAPGYRKYLTYQLGVEMAPQWTKRDASLTVQKIAVTSKADIKRMNVQRLHLPQDPNFPAALTQRFGGKGVDIRRGDW